MHTKFLRRQIHSWAKVDWGNGRSKASGLLPEHGWLSRSTICSISLRAIRSSYSKLSNAPKPDGQQLPSSHRVKQCLHTMPLHHIRARVQARPLAHFANEAKAVRLQHSKCGLGPRCTLHTGGIPGQ